MDPPNMGAIGYGVSAGAGSADKERGEGGFSFIYGSCHIPQKQNDWMKRNSAVTTASRPQQLARPCNGH